MCQLTLIDFKDKRLAAIARNIVTLNVGGISTNKANDHGFGAFFFESNHIIRTELDAVDYIEKNPDYNSRSSYNGMYHVRLASVATKRGLEFAHPFIYPNIQLMHNGTLSLKSLTGGLLDKKELSKLDSATIIDSEKITQLLNYTMERDTFTPKLFEDVRNYFTGASAFMFKDLKTNAYYVFRDNKRPLELATFTVNDKVVGILINTGAFELNIIVDAMIDAYNSYSRSKHPLKVTLEPLPDHTLHQYIPNTYELTSSTVIAESTAATSPVDTTMKTNVFTYGHPAYDYSVYTPTSHSRSAVSSSNSNTFRLFNNLAHLNLYDSEFFVMAEQITGKSFALINEEDIKLLVEVTGHMVNAYEGVLKSRLSKWFKCKIDYSCVNGVDILSFKQLHIIYSTCERWKLFPAFFNNASAFKQLKKHSDTINKRLKLLTDNGGVI